MFILCFFFFSSRRRHTRYWRDWSSDVCSSDLGYGKTEGSRPRGRAYSGANIRILTEKATANRGLRKAMAAKRFVCTPGIAETPLCYRPPTKQQAAER